MPDLTQEQLNFLLSILIGSFANTDSPTTALNRAENYFDVLGISPEILFGTTWPAYTQPLPFDESSFLTKTISYMNSTTPAWRRAAQGLYSGELTAADAYYELTKALGGDLTFDKKFIQDEINAMQNEIAEKDRAFAEYNNSVLEDQRTNIYGKAGLPQPYEEFGYGEGQTPPPASERTREQQNFMLGLMQELEDSGYNKAMADKPGMKATKMGLAVEDYYRQNPSEYYSNTGREGKYKATAEYQPPGSVDNLGRVDARGGVKYNYEAVPPSDEDLKEIGDRIKLLAEQTTQPSNNPLLRMIRSGLGKGLEKTIPGYDKVEADLKRVYGPIEAKGNALKARIGEQKMVGDMMMALDLLSAQRAGKTPLSEAMQERFGSFILPFISNIPAQKPKTSSRRK